MAPNDLKWAKNYPKWPKKKDSEFLTNSAIETQKTQKFGVNSEILTPLEPLFEILHSGKETMHVTIVMESSHPSLFLSDAQAGKTRLQ